MVSAVQGFVLYFVVSLGGGKKGISLSGRTEMFFSKLVKLLPTEFLGKPEFVFTGSDGEVCH
jgi:hypothetical protein